MTYEYECKSCGHEWEEQQKINDEPRLDCPRCGEKSAQRLISRAPGFLLKGRTWARDGYS